MNLLLINYLLEYDQAIMLHL